MNFLSNILKNIYSVTKRYVRPNGYIATKKYKIVKFCFLKFSFRQAIVLGKNNKVLLFDENNKEYLDVTGSKDILHYINVVIEGDNNTVILPKDYISTFNKSSITIYGSNNKVDIGSGCKFDGLNICMSYIRDIHQGNRKVLIGKNCTSTRKLYIRCCGEGVGVTIGEDCMFATNVVLSTTDWHPVCSLATNERLNPDEDIVIGDHVWVCDDVKIMKGVSVPDGCVVGIGSLVNKKFAEKNCIIAGIPAKQRKSDIKWSR